MIKYNNDVFCLFKIFQFLQIVPVQCKQQFQASFQVQEWMELPILCILMYESKLNKKKFFDHFIFDFYIIDLFFPKKKMDMKQIASCLRVYLDLYVQI